MVNKFLLKLPVPILLVMLIYFVVDKTDLVSLKMIFCITVNDNTKNHVSL